MRASRRGSRGARMSRPERRANPSVQPQRVMIPLTWKALVEREPELARLRREVESVRDENGPSFCANKVWYIRFKPRVRALTGRQARRNDPVLRSNEAYDLAYNTLYRLLPDCRNCVCMPWSD